MSFYGGLKKFGHAMDMFRRVFLSLLFWSIVILLIVILVRTGPPRIRNNSLLVVRPQGRLVYAYTSPIGNGGNPVDGYDNEILLDDLVSAIGMGAMDSRIVGLWVDLDELSASGYAAAAELSNAIEEFRKSGKPVLASANYFGNARYRIASPADYIIVDRLGEVRPVGYGYWQAYLGEMMERFGVEVQLFRSEESKAAAERVISSEMSEAVRENNKRLFDDLWGLWLEDVAKNRELEVSELAEWIENYDVYLAKSNGDGSDAALRGNLVDAIETGGTLDARLKLVLGDTEQIDAIDYTLRVRRGEPRSPIIAVIPVVGPMVHGRGGPGIAGSYDVVNAIDRARNTPRVEAIVLRIDSPGGDVWAGELIRRALEETRKEWNLPIVASLGDSAASAAYWIAIESDLIITSPETITGSIGVFSIALSFEEALSKWLSVRVDGVGTTRWQGGFHPGRKLDERESSLFSLSVSDIDGFFRRIVAERRELPRSRVDELAGGVWSGLRALDYHLVDESGGSRDAKMAAAELAGLTRWEVMYFEREVDYGEELFRRLLSRLGETAARRESLFF